MARDFAARLKRRTQKAGLALSPEAAVKLEAYFDLLSRWNEKINLTALNLKSGDEAVDRLLVEPLLAARAVSPTEATLIDIGSGGGSPAIPLAIASPHLALTMVEVKVRKSAFLREAVRTLDLRAQVLTSRFEALLADPAMHEFADILSLRAVRVDAKTLAGLQAFVRPKGRFFLFKPEGPVTDNDIPPTLAVADTVPLVESLRSQLVILNKRPVGRRNVPRETS